MSQEDLKPYSIVRNLSLTLNGSSLLCNRYMSLNNDFFLRFFSNSDKENELLIIHPDTDRILSSAIVCAAFSCIFNGKVDTERYYEQFTSGETVIRNGERYRYVGIKDGMCVLTSDDTLTTHNSVTKIPLKSGLNIRPYSGNSSRTGRQGTIRSHLDAGNFLRHIVGDKYQEQAITLPLCTLVVCSRETAQQIANNLSFVERNCSYRFADVFPFAWAHSVDNFEMLFGTVGKPEPAFLFTNRISLARELLYEDFDYQKRISTVILFDVDPRAAPQSEIQDIREQINRRKDGYFITLQSNSKVSETICDIIDERVQTVVWSSEVLLSTIDDLYHKPQSPDDQLIMTAINRTIDDVIERVEVPSLPALADLKECKTILKHLVCIKNRASNINEFILCAYGLINLFEQAAFTMREYENSISEGLIGARSPRQQIEKLYKLTDSLNNSEISDMAESVSLMLAEAYSSLYDANPKREALLRCVTEARKFGKSFHIVVTKHNYIDIVRKLCGCMGSKTIFVPARLRHGIDVERLIITATPNVKKDGYNPLAGRAANETILLEYKSETVKNDCYQRMIDRAFTSINSSAKRSASKLFGITIETEDCVSAVKASDKELDEAKHIEIELTNIEIATVLGHVIDRNKPGSMPIHVIRLAQFDTGEWAMFSQYYTVYVFDSSTEKLIEKFPVDLCEGENVVFSSTSSEITDFVDEILRQLIQRGNHVLEEHYVRSRQWKKVLGDYINVNSLNYKDISDRMRECGYPRHPATIGTWLREDSAIVGPRDVDTFIAIGLAVENEEIANHAYSYKRSCDVIRSQRMKILEYVQSSIIHSKERHGEEAVDDFLSDEEKSYLGDIRKYARELTIERIIPCERDVPAHLVNRPIGR